MTKEEWLFPNAIIPVDVETTAALVAEIKRLIDVVGGMALAQPEQEPVEFEEWHKANYMQSLEKYGEIYKNNHVRCRHQGWLGAQSPPPQRTWVSLTDEEMMQIYIDLKSVAGFYSVEKYAQAIEAKLRSKNENR